MSLRYCVEQEYLQKEKATKEQEVKEKPIPKHQQLLNEIEDAGTEGITRRELVGVTRFITRHRRKEMLEDLLEADMIVCDMRYYSPYHGEVFWTSENHLKLTTKKE